jgi:hypothetical protein
MIAEGLRSTPNAIVLDGTPHRYSRGIPITDTSERRSMMCSPPTPQPGQSKNEGKTWAWR